MGYCGFRWRWTCCMMVLFITYIWGREKGFTCYIRLMIRLIILFISHQEIQYGVVTHLSKCVTETRIVSCRRRHKLNSIQKGQRKPTLSRSFSWKKELTRLKLTICRWLETIWLFSICSPFIVVYVLFYLKLTRKSIHCRNSKYHYNIY